MTASFSFTPITAYVRNGQKLIGLTAAGNEQNDIPHLQKTKCATHRPCGRSKACRTLDTAYQMGKMLAGHGHMTAAYGTDAGVVCQSLNGTGKLDSAMGSRRF